jgi:hypothetical protein
MSTVALMRWYEAQHNAKICGRCGAPIERGQTVSIVKWIESRDGSSRASQGNGPVCEACAYGRRYTEPRACDGCGRPVRFTHNLFRARSDDGASPRTDQPIGLPRFTVCSRKCAERAYAKAQKARRHAARTEIRCQACGKPFLPRRSDTKACSSACRQRLHRGRHRADVVTDNA